MRLINADVALQRFIQETKDSGKPVIHINTIKRILQDIDTAYDVDKVVEQLGDRSTLARPVGWSKSYEIITLNDAIEIARAGGVNE